MDFMSASPRGGKNQNDIMRQQQAAPQHGPLGPQQPSFSKQASDKIKNRAMEKGLDAGEEKLVEAFTPATTLATPSATQMAGLESLAGTSGAGLSPGAAQAVLGSSSSAAPLVAEAAGMTSAGLAGTTGAGLATTAGTSAAATAGAGAGMAALGTAVPYVGAALLAGKALGFFNEGGQVGPLNPQYKAGGGYTSKDIQRMDEYMPDASWEQVKQDLGLDSSDNKYTWLSEYRGWDAEYDNAGGVAGRNQSPPQYRMSGGPLGMGALSMYHDMMKKNMKSDGGPITPEYKMSGGPLGMGALSMYHDMMKKNMR